MRIKVTPVEGRVVRDPQHGRIVPPEGSEVVATAYWRRLELDGDITIGDEALVDEAPVDEGEGDDTDE